MFLLLVKINSSIKNLLYIGFRFWDNLIKWNGARVLNIEWRQSIRVQGERNNILKLS